MAGLDYTLGAIPAGGTRRTYGTAYYDGSKWWASINGNLLDARWADPVMPAQDSKIVVDITGEGNGLFSAFVVAMYTEQPRPSTATVSVVGLTELVILGADGGGVAYVTDRFLGVIGDYTVGDAVRLRWSEGRPMVLDIISSLVVPREQDPPPTSGGGSAPTGYEVITATASDTYGVGGWGRWSTSQNGGEDVFTGTQGGYTVTGSWFYGAPRPVLQGKTITKILFRLPARMPNAGSSGPITLNLYAHTSGSRPGGDVTRTVGPHTITVPAGYNPSMVLEAGSPPGYVQLPLTFAPALVAGGGVSIAGGSYAGFNSRLDDPESGKIIQDWAA
jgi:hypothetical protein